jgi:predicted alpha/beta superfamily hydrolase
VTVLCLVEVLMLGRFILCAALTVVLVLAMPSVQAASSERPAMLTFMVRVPEYTPQDAKLFIAGSLPSLGPWDPGKVELGKVGDGLYAITLVLPVDTEFAFKFTRGTWESVEKGPRFEEIGDRTHVVVGDETVSVEVANWRDFSSGPARESITGDVEIYPDFRATRLGNRRSIIVLLPPGYHDDTERRYPVLYMHDGQNLFDSTTSFIGVEWGVDEAANRLMEEGQVEPLIIVGIYNTSNRAYEYTPAADASRGDGGGAELYADFIINDLKPFIDKTYRTKPDRAHTGVMGSSLGGVCSLYLGWEHADVFSRIGAMSTSYGWANKDIVRRIEASAPAPGLRLWIDMGTAEETRDRDGDGVPDIIELHRAVRDTLVGYGMKLGRDLMYVEAEGAVHNEHAWAARFPRALKFLFPKR